jgi:hypothetical protein
LAALKAHHPICSEIIEPGKGGDAALLVFEED